MLKTLGNANAICCVEGIQRCRNYAIHGCISKTCQFDALQLQDTWNNGEFLENTEIL